ncbi:hypothetical protein [Bacteroides fragilis]|nr:hypothetical protein [Bacteroides fragilis]
MLCRNCKRRGPAFPRQRQKKRISGHTVITLKIIRIMPFWEKMFNQKQAVYYPRALVDSDRLKWIELSPDTGDQEPASSDSDGDQKEPPLG